MTSPINQGVEGALLVVAVSAVPPSHIAVDKNVVENIEQQITVYVVPAILIGF